MALLFTNFPNYKAQIKILLHSSIYVLEEINPGAISLFTDYLKKAYQFPLTMVIVRVIRIQAEKVIANTVVDSGSEPELSVFL
jgi:hypothetical protein